MNYKYVFLYLSFLLGLNLFGQETCTTYSETPNTAISSSGTNTYNTIINIPDSYTLTDINVTLDISHTYNSDLDIYLVSPLGTRIALAISKGGSSDDFNNVTFDDDSSNTLPTGNSTLSGDYQPEGSLIALFGENVNGNWTIEVSDTANQDGGTINTVAIEICYGGEVPIVDEVCSEYTETPNTEISEVGENTYNTIINVPESFILASITVTMDITHTYNSDLDIYIISPLGTRIELSTNKGGSGDNYSNVTFDDDSSNTLPTGNVTLSGDYQPVGSLATLIGENVNGNWTVEISDTANADGGTINSITLGLCVETTSNIGGHLGPGGVGNVNGTSSLILWTNPDNITEAENASFASWEDVSGYESDLAQGTTSLQPKIKKGVVNGYDAVSFESTNSRLRKTNFSDFATDGLSGFYINKTTDTADGILSYASSANDKDFFINRSNNYRIHVTGSNVNSGLIGNNNNWNIVGFRWQGSDGSTTFSLNGNSGYSGTLASGSSITTGGTLALGGKQTSIDGGYPDTNAHQGQFSEIILFNSYLAEVERIIIANYLAAKYNISLSANDYYTQDTSGENFDFNVSGIGQDTDGSFHTDSQGTGIIRINTPSDLDDDEYLFWGEDVKNANYNFSASEANNYIDRLDTKWKVNKRNDLGTVSISIRQSDITLNSINGCNDLKLIVSSSSTFSSKTTYDLELSMGIYKATNVLLNNNDYFTLEYVDTVVLDGTTAYNGTGTFNVPSTSDTCYKLLVKNTADGTPSLTENANVREVEIEAGGKLVINSGTRLEVTNGLHIDGDIKLVGSAQLIQTHTGESQITGSGNLYVDQNSDLASVYRYNYWTSPVISDAELSTYTVKAVMKDGTTVTSATSNPADLQFTSETNGSISPLTISSDWIYGYLNGNDDSTWSRKRETGTFNSGEGYLMKSPGAAQNYTFKGLPNDGDISFSISADNTSLLGNPYPSAIDANQLFADSQNLGTIYFWEHKNETSSTSNEGHYTSNYIGGYGYRNATMGTAADQIISGTAGLGGETYTAPERYIPIGQGFFASTADGLAATVNFKNGQRNFETEAGGNSHFFRISKKEKEKLEYAVLKIGFEAKNSEDNYIHSQVGISFSEGKTFNSEISFDSKKAEIKDSDIYFKFQEDGNELVIAGIQEVSNDLLVPITLKIDNTDDVFLLLDDKQNITEEVFILDAEENIHYDFSNPIRLNIPKGIYSNRFYITFSDHQFLSSKYVLLNNSFNIYQKETTNELVIKNLDGNDIHEISLFNFTGKKVINITNDKTLKEEEIILETNSITEAVYILKIITIKGVVSRKIFIKK